MPIAGQTREVAREIIGRNLGGARFFLATNTSCPGDTTSIIDSTRLGFLGNDELIGYWARAISGCNDLATRKVTDSVTGTGDLVVAAFANNTATSDTFELWPPEFNPDHADVEINNAIIASYGRGYAPLESEAIHTGGNQLRFALPSSYSYLSKILQRTSVTSLVLHSCEVAFDEAVPSGITVATDSVDKRNGNSSLRFTITTAAAAGALISDSLTSTDFSRMTHLELWLKSNIATLAVDIDVLVDDTASCASPLETLSLPALVPDTWTFVRLALSAPETLTAIISVALQFAVDNGAQVLQVDDMRFVDENTAKWEPYHWDAWQVDKANRGFYFRLEANQVGYGLLRLIGGQEPQVLTADACTLPIDDEYIIARATARMFAQTGMEKYQKSVVEWEGRAASAYRGGVPRPATARWVQ